MGRSFGAIDPKTDVGDWAGARSFWQARRRMYEMTRSGDELAMVSYAVSWSGTRNRARADRPTHWLGSGDRIRAYLARRHNRFRKLHFAWHGQGGGWAPFPMQERGAAPDDWLGHNCLFCHASYPRNDLSAKWPAAVDLPPTALQFDAIDCERCHGPAARHVELARRRAPEADVRTAVVNPKKLDAERAMDVCLQCHLQPTTRFPVHRLHRPGRKPWDFKPGERLSDHVVVFDYDAAGRDREHVADTDIDSHGYLLRQSACFTRSGGRLTCTSCHDPHRTPPPAERTAYFRQKCLACHDALRCKTPDVPPEKRASSDCVSCHMAPVYALDAARTLVHRHKIERRPVSNRAQPVEARIAHAFRPRRPDARVALALAPESFTPADRALWTALGLLHNHMPVPDLAGLPAQLDHAGIDDPDTRHLLARALLESGDPARAREQVEKALAVFPAHATAAADLAELERLSRSPRAAERLLHRVLREFPLDLEARWALVEALEAQGRQTDMRAEVAEWEHALDAHRDVQSPRWLGIALDKTHHREEAIVWLREALKVDPRDGEAAAALAEMLRGPVRPR